MLRAKLEEVRVADLKDMLRYNDQKTSGAKPELVNRCLDAIINGALPKCPRCRVGHLVYLGSGRYGCAGSFDQQQKRVRDCSFESTDIERIPWKTPAGTSDRVNIND